MNELICSKKESTSQEENSGTQYKSSIHLIFFNFPAPTVQGRDILMGINED